MPATYRVRRAIALGSGLRRGLLLLVAGLIAFILGSALSYKRVIIPFFTAVSKATQRLMGRVVGGQDVDVAVHILGLLLMIVGLAGLVLGARTAIAHVVETFSGIQDGKVDEYRRRVQLASGPRIVAIGGGTGLSTLLRGLKQYTSNIVAIVTVTDDGGGSGRLRREKGIIPPGDIRNCLVALADADKAMGDLFQFRFDSSSGSLAGQSLGNLLITALADQAKGDFEQAVRRAGEVLAIRGRVVPSTFGHVGLVAGFDGGERVEGEEEIVRRRGAIRTIALTDPEVTANPEAVRAIQEADLIVMGPGSVFTSVIPNLLVGGLREAILAAKVPRVYVCNVMTQPGETDGMSASEHASAIFRACEGKPFDYVVINTGVPSPEVLDKYAGSGQHLVDPDYDRLKAMSLRVLRGDTLSSTDGARHDPAKVAQRIMTLLQD